MTFFFFLEITTVSCIEFISSFKILFLSYCDIAMLAEKDRIDSASIILRLNMFLVPINMSTFRFSLSIIFLQLLVPIKFSITTFGPYF